MAIANLHEKLLFYTRQKSRITMQLSDLQMQQLAATRQQATKQQEFNQKLSALYYDEDCGFGTDFYPELLAQLQNDHEYEMGNLNAWESQLDLEKENLETQLNEIQQYENSWNKLLTGCIKKDFTYGGGGGK